MKGQLKLYVWEDVLRDYTGGVMFAMARSVKEARDLIERKLAREGHSLSGAQQDLKNRPLVRSSPSAFYCSGGG